MSDQAKIVLKGRIKTIFPGEVYGNFEKRVMWLAEEDSQYPQTYTIEFHGGDGNTLDAFKEGQQVECHINLRGRHSVKGEKEYVFNSLQCWRIKKLSDALAEQKPEPAQVEAKQPDLGYTPVAASDDLPF